MGDLGQIFGQLGFPIALAVWFLWRDQAREKFVEKRESDLIGRVRLLEDERVKSALTLVEKMQKSLHDNTEAFKAMMTASLKQSSALAARPCLSNKHTTDDFAPHIQEENGNAL